MRITDDYKQLNKLLHDLNPEYGSDGGQYFAPLIRAVCVDNSFREILDYGCGKGSLARSLTDIDVKVTEYDPAIPGKDHDPDPCELVVCIDVLEHVEPECIDDVLGHIAACATKAAYFVIDVLPAQKTLPDGRNAHLLVKDPEWWCNKLEETFRLLSFEFPDENSTGRGRFVFACGVPV